MAKYNEILVGRYNQALQKLFGIKGPAPAPQISGDIQINHSFFSGAENRSTEMWFRFAGLVNNGAVAGLTTAFRLRNPTNSGVIAVVESLTIWTAAADKVDERRRGPNADVDLSSTTGGFPAERRIPNFSLSSLRMSLDLAGNQLGNFHAEYGTQANVMVQLIQNEDQERVIDPGEWLQLHTTVANNAFTVNAIWRERILEEGEARV